MERTSYIKQIMRKNLQNLGLHLWVEQVREKHQKIEVCVCVCIKAFFLSRIQRRISIESKIKRSGGLVCS